MLRKGDNQGGAVAARAKITRNQAVEFCQTFHREIVLDKAKGVKLYHKEAYIAALRYKEGMPKKKARAEFKRMRDAPNTKCFKENGRLVWPWMKATSTPDGHYVWSIRMFGNLL